MKKRFICHKCKKKFTEGVNLNNRGKTISNKLEQKILKDLLNYNLSISYIAKENKVSPGTVRNILKNAMSEYPEYVKNLPRVISFDEFKADTNSVLLGTGSYWEGISIEGKTLSNLIIFRLPFPVPEPIIDYKRSISKDGLMDVSVPEMVIKLKQGIGRLIRNKNDSGIVSIIDPRLGDNSNVPYKQLTWDALPIKNRTSDIEKAKEFYLKLNDISDQ